MSKPSYMFTNKNHPLKGITSAALGCIDIVCMAIVIFLCFKQKGEASSRFAVIAMFSLIFSAVGFVMGVMSRMEKDKYYLFPNIGIVTNFFVITFIIFMLILGVS